MTYDVVVAGGRVVTPHGIVEGDLCVSGETIAGLRAPRSATARRVIQAEGRLVLPGIVDSHVHARDPGATHKEDFATCSRAAAAGGVTTIMCMPNTSPVVSSPEALRRADRIASAQSVVDYCLQASATADNTGELRALAELGAVSYEVFLGGAPDEMLVHDVRELRAVLQAIAGAGGLAGVYPDEPALIGVLEDLSTTDAGGVPRAYRPHVEAIGLLEVAAVAATIRCRLHVRQVSSALAARCATWLRRTHGNLHLTAEVTPHHLTLSDEDFRRLGAVAHVLPPLRPPSDVDALWRALRRAGIDTIGSDHAPHAREEKMRGCGDAHASPPGFPGLETFLPVMMTEFRARDVPLRAFVRLACENPARLFGLYPRKGTLQAGSDADVVVVDDSTEWRVEAHRFFSKARWSPFDGRRVTARPVVTIVRGQVVFAGGEVVGTPGCGKLQVPARRET
jgi:dihydroorotase